MTEKRNVLIIGGAIASAAMEVAAARGISLSTSAPYPEPQALVEAANAVAANALIVRLGRVPGSAIDRIPSLRIIAKHGVGVDGIDLDAASARDIPVVIAGGANSRSVGEHALALLLSVCRSVTLLDRRVREGHWDKATYVGSEISGKQVGLIGLGAIGRTFLSFLEPFGVRAKIYDPFLSNDAVPAGAERVTDVPSLLAGSDIVSLHCPLTRDNRGLIGRTAIAQMKPGAILINTARGELVDEAALLDALRAGTIAGAGLDTFANEPVAADNPLLLLDNVVVSPHIGANTHEARVRVGVRCIEQIANYLDRGTLDRGSHVNKAARVAA